MRVIARRERPHPGAQLRITDQEGWRITVFATNTRGGRLADLEVRHRLRARAEDRPAFRARVHRAVMRVLELKEQRGLLGR